jgi:signal transduction histidine kinase
LAGGELTGLITDPGFFSRVSRDDPRARPLQRREDRASPRTVTAATSRSAARGFGSRTVDHLLAIVNDITEQKVAQLALRAAHDELEGRVRDRTAELELVNHQLSLVNEKLVSARDHAIDASKAKSAFLANMSHELRTPLNAIIGYSELIEEESQEPEPDDQPRRRQDPRGRPPPARAHRRHPRRLEDRGRQDGAVRRGRSTPRELLDEVMNDDRAARRAQPQRLVLELRCPPTSAQVHTDRTKLKQVALNLLSNACKFTHEGTVRADRPAQPVQRRLADLEVKDTGIGIPTDRLEELFQPFRQADESTTRKYGGTGLGLSISRHYCQMMQGSIHCESAPGRGSTFTVRLPSTLTPNTPRNPPQPNVLELSPRT